MSIDNEFSFGNLGKDYDDRKVNNDYLDLLSETDVDEGVEYAKKLFGDNVIIKEEN